MTGGSPEAEPFAFCEPLSVCVDVKLPQTYLALQGMRSLADELELAVDWLPFPTAAMKPPPSGEDRGSRHRRTRARYQEMDLERYARAQGITIRSPYRSADTTLVSVALLWLRERAPLKAAEFLEQVCADYWREALDVERLEAVGGIVAALGEDAEAFARFAAGDGPSALTLMRGRLVAAGVFTVPSLVVAGEVFVGRAHLPMVRWLLSGREGPPPV